jgi:alcohol dehydrogenase
MSIAVNRTFIPFGGTFFEPFGTIGLEVESLERELHHQPHIDLHTSREQFQIVAIVGDVDPDALHVTIDDETCLLTLKYEKKIEKGQSSISSQEPDIKYLLQEKGKGSFIRVFQLPHAILFDQVNAELNDDKLIITIPRDTNRLMDNHTMDQITEISEQVQLEPVKELKEIPLFMTAAVTETFDKEHPNSGVHIVESFAGPSRIKSDEVVVKMIYSSVNRIDYQYNTGKFWFGPTAPFVGGRDGVGEIIELGNRSAKNFKKHDIVLGLCDSLQFGTFGQYAIFKQSAITKKPDEISLEHVAGLPLALLTASSVFERIKDPRKLKRILIHGGSGGVGSWLVMMAKYMYHIPEVITTCRASNFEYVKELGADIAINYLDEKPFDQVVLETVPHTQNKAPLDAVLDTVGGDDILERSYRLLDSNGYFVTTVTLVDFDHRSMPQEIVGFGMETLRNKLSHMLGAGPEFYSVKVRSDGHKLEQLLKWIMEKNLHDKIQVVKYPLNEITTALEQIHSMHTDGKMIVDMSHTIMF